MGSKQTIELNGKRYDARTGRLITSSGSTSPQTAKTHKKQPAQNVDGVQKVRHHPPRKVSTQKTHRQTHRSHTLKRTAVKKPHQPKPIASHPAKQLSEISTAATPEQVAYSVPQDRLQRLQKVKQSSKISRYNMPTTAPSASHHATKAKKARSPQPNHVVKAVSTVVEPAEQPLNSFDRAIDNAQSHTTGKPRKPSLRSRTANKLRISTRALNATGFIVAGMLLAGYFGYNSAPNLSMRVAAMRSEVSGSLPEYQPAGFSLNRSIQYQPGEIKLSFTSNSDGNRSFEITQRTSAWDSYALHQNFVAQQKEVRTIEERGKTIYLYDDDNATWVDGGIWYRIEGNSALNSEQLSRLASSL